MPEETNDIVPFFPQEILEPVLRNRALTVAPASKKRPATNACARNGTVAGSATKTNGAWKVLERSFVRRAHVRLITRTKSGIVGGETKRN